jgi:hypothetical protein
MGEPNVRGKGAISKFGRNAATVTGDAIQDESSAILLRKYETPVEIVSSDVDDDQGGTEIIGFTRDIVGAAAGAPSLTPNTTVFTSPATVASVAGTTGKRETVTITINDVADGDGTIDIKLSEALTLEGIVTLDGDTAIEVAASIYAAAALFVGWTLSPPVGVGALTVKVLGVDGDWNPIEEIVSLNGTTLVALTKSYLYIHRAYIVETGTWDVNFGVITIRAAGSGDTLALITAGYGQTKKAVMPVYAGCRLCITNIRFEGQLSISITGELALVQYEEGKGKLGKDRTKYLEDKHVIFGILLLNMYKEKYFEKKEFQWEELEQVFDESEQKDYWAMLFFGKKEATPTEIEKRKEEVRKTLNFYYFFQCFSQCSFQINFLIFK